MEKQEQPKKSKECIHCQHFFDCQGKDKGKTCLQFVERKNNDGIH